MKQKINTFFWITVMVFILAVPNCFSFLSTSIESYYNFSTDAKDYFSLHDGVVTDAVLNETVPSYRVGGDGSPKSYYFDGTGDYTTIPYNIPYASSNASINFWVRRDGNPDVYDTVFNDAYTGGAQYQGIRIRFPSGTSISSTYYYATTSSTTSTAVGLADATWYMITVTWNKNTKTAKFYVNGTEKDSDVLAAVINTAANNIILSNQDTGTLNFKGYIDEVGLWKKVLSTDEITELYNTGMNFSVVSPFTISANNKKLGTALNVFNATVNGTFYSTTNGTINTAVINSEKVIPITVRADNFKDDYYASFNLTDDLISNLSVLFNVTTIDTNTGLNINSFSAVLNATLFSTTTGIIRGPYTYDYAALINVTSSSSGYYSAFYDNINTSSSTYAINLTPILYVNLTYPSENQSINSNFNSTFTPAFNMSVCRAMVNNSLTPHNILYNLTANVSYALEYYISLFNQSSNLVYILCNLTNGTAASSNSVNVWVDTFLPSITTNFDGGRYYYVKDDNITAQFNFTDEVLLFSYNISVDGVSISYNTSSSRTYYNYNLTVSPSDYTIGFHNLSVRIADGHTAYEIPEYEVSYGLFNNKLIYSWYAGNVKKSVEIVQDSFLPLFDRFSTKKYRDRYTFIYEPNNIKKDYEFVVKSTDKIHIAENVNTPYKKWIISDGRWLDFYLPNEPEITIDIIRINDYEVKVIINNIKKPEKQIYSSIGEINVVTQNYNFSVFNVSMTYPESTIEEIISPFSLVLFHNGTTTPNATAMLRYNNTNKSVTETINPLNTNFSSLVTAPRIYGTNSSLPIAFNWNLTIGLTHHNFSGISNVYPLRLSDCRLNTSWPIILTFHSVNEESNRTEYVSNMDMNVNLDLKLNDESHVSNVFFEFHGGNNYSVCIQPNVTNMIADAIIEYSASGYTHRKYYLNDFALLAALNNVYLYQLNTSKASDIIMSVYDKNTGEAVPDVYIKILRYYPNLNEYKVVEIEKTDENGQTLSKMVLADVFYKFMLEYAGDIVLDSTVQKMITVTKTFYISLTSDILESFRRIGDVNTNVSCTESTKTCRFTWSDTTNLVRSAEFKVFRVNGLGNVEIYHSNSSSSSGTLVYTITEDTNNSVYMARGYIHTNTTNSWYAVGEATMNFLKAVKELFGTAGLFPLLLLMISMMAALLDVGAMGVIAGSILILLVGMITGILAINVTMIITIIIMGIVLIGRIRA